MEAEVADVYDAGQESFIGETSSFKDVFVLAKVQGHVVGTRLA